MVIKSIITIIFGLSASLLAQISPGELSNSHFKLEGLSNCTKCHLLGKGLSNDKCLDCHSEIKTRIKNNRGYHSSSDVVGKNCWECHSEHNGRNFKLIRFDTKNFNHSKTGYSLLGKHLQISCESCHNKNLIKDEGLKKKSFTFLGLNRNCTSCHNDFHDKTAGENCETCHNTENFKSEIKFEHNRTSFKLQGAHQKVNCTNCHKRALLGNNIEVIKFISNNNTKCLDCHEDIHQGKFGLNCQQCHNVNSFTQVSASNFDHSKTNFPLLGRHKFVECKDCHKQKVTIKLEHDKCYKCHYDYHKGQFKVNNQIQDCKNCHNENGFSPSSFSIEQHQKTKFPLLGSHIAVDCKSCHYKNSQWSFRFELIKCINCHQNVHRDEISVEYLGDNDCSNCHNTKDWRTINFDHNRTNFQLKGKHSQISCSTCHIKKINDIKVSYFKSLKSECLDCHYDFHYKQYTSNLCENCHSFDKWIPSNFNHDNSRFKLQGVHKKVSCINCHPKLEINKTQQFYILFRTGKIECKDCHQ